MHKSCSTYVGRFLRPLSYCLVAVALLFLFEKLWANWQTIVAQEATGNIVSVLGWGAVFYAGNCFLLSAAWYQLLVWQGVKRARFALCHRVYARTQIAKYLPGNIFHYAGRQVVGKRAGLGDAALAMASLHEIIGVIVASGTIALAGVAFLGLGGTQIASIEIAWVLLLVLSVPAVLSIALIKWPKMRSRLGLQVRPLPAMFRYLGLTYLLYLLFFLLLGGILFAVVQVVSDVRSIGGAGQIITAFSVSWMLGYITPGSPAGLGVREAVLVILLTGLVGEPESVLVALVFRGISLLGDLLFFLTSFAGVRGGAPVDPE